MMVYTRHNAVISCSCCSPSRMRYYKKSSQVVFEFTRKCYKTLHLGKAKRQLES